MRIYVQSFARVTVALAMLLGVGVSHAYAITIRGATLAGGSVQISGSQAAKSAPISWEGAVVATSSKGGSFAFTTAVIPADCVGTLSDGTSTIEVPVAGCGSAGSTLLATGQIISYAAGDDGDVQAGVVLSYTDNGDGTVTDNNTRLVWEKKTDASVNVNYTWYTALDYVASLNSMNGGQGFAGHNDWRLPNVRELLSIIDYSRTAPSVDPIFGPTMGVSNFVDYWTSTSSVVDGNVAALAVDFKGVGGVMAFGKGSFLRVRAVRGGS
jgi:hypothetical protein